MVNSVGTTVRMDACIGIRMIDVMMADSGVIITIHIIIPPSVMDASVLGIEIKNASIIESTASWLSSGTARHLPSKGVLST